MVLFCAVCQGLCYFRFSRGALCHLVVVLELGYFALRQKFAPYADDTRLPGGFALLVNNGAFGHSASIDESFELSLEVLIAGMKTLEEHGDNNT